MQNVTTLEQLRSKMQLGDYEQVGEMLGCSRDAAKMRLRRNKPEALKALGQLIDSREELKKNYQTKKH